MRFVINRSALQGAIAVPVRIAAKSLTAHTACVLVSATSDQVTFEATDLTESSRCSQIALVEKQGSILIPASSLMSVVKTLPDEAVTVSSDDKGSVCIQCGKSSFSLPALSPDDFPGFPTIDSLSSVTIPFSLFEPMAKAACTFTAKHDGCQEFLKGVYVEYSGSELRMTASDSYHIIRSVKSDGISGDNFTALVPVAVMAAATSVKCANEAVLCTSDNQIQITCGDTTVISRAIDASFPNTDRFYAGDRNATAEFDRLHLLGTAKRALAVSSAFPISVRINDGHADISLTTKDSGSMQESIDTKTEGMCTASFNASYLIDALKSMASENVTMIFDNPLKPIIVEDESTSCVIMPVRSS